MNPYAAYIAGEAPMDVIAATPERLRNLLGRIGKDGARRNPAPEKWSAREILCHLADSIRQVLAEPHHVIQPFDQEKWATHYGAFEAEAAAELFSALRAWNLALIRSVPPETMRKTLTHPERGTMTFAVLIETMAGHDINHVQQLEAIASRSGG